MAVWHLLVTKNILKTSADRLGIEEAHLHHIGGFDNVIYGFRKESRDCILRISHSRHRMHTLAKQYTVPEEIEPRPSKDTLVINLNSAADLEPNDKLDLDFTVGSDSIDHLNLVLSAPSHTAIPFARQKYIETAERIESIQRNSDVYGLCHRDLHQGNFFVHEGKITAFDFDDCGYDYFMQDIAMAVYYSASFPDWRKPESDRRKISGSANSFLESFMKGYRRENDLDSRHLELLPLFIERRRCDLCLMLYGECSQESANPELRRWLERNLREIAGDCLCLELDV